MDSDFGFGSDLGSGSDGNAEIENKYYLAKSIKEVDLVKAISNFQDINEGEYAFKAKKQIYKCVLLLHQNGEEQLKEILTYSLTLLPYYFEKSINNLIDFTCIHVVPTQAIALLLQVSKYLEQYENTRIWTKVHLKLASFYLQERNFNPLPKLFKQLQKTLSESSESQATQSLEVAALEIQYYSETKNNRKLKELYTQTLTIRSAVPHPKITGIIRECGGKMYCFNNDYENARKDFFESFKNYDEAGAPERIRVLKYLVLCNILSSSKINPFESPETKPFKTDPEIVGLTKLMEAYQTENIEEFQIILNKGKDSFLSDSFIKRYIDDVLEEIRIQTILTTCEEFNAIELPLLLLMDKLHINKDQLQLILIKMILDKKLNGVLIDSKQVISLNKQPSTTNKELKLYSTYLYGINTTIKHKINTF